MKAFNRIMVWVLASAALSACSSYDDPDMAFKGKVDEAFLTALARGEASVAFHKKDVRTYEKEYTAYQRSNGKWEEVKEDQLGIGKTLVPDMFSISDGRTWALFDFDRTIEEESLLAGSWNIHCKRTGYDKEIYEACPFEFNATDKKVTINGREFEVEKAEGDELIISMIGTLYSTDEATGEWGPSHAYKDIYFLNKKAPDVPDPDKITYYDSHKDVLLAIVRLLRSEYGDTFNMGSNLTYPHVNLAQIEENIVNDCTGQYIGNLFW